MKDTTLINELRAQFSNLTSLITKTVESIDADIQENVAVINGAYHEIKEDKEMLGEIALCAEDFANAMGVCAEESKESAEDSERIIDDCYELVNDGYIEDTEYFTEGEDEEIFSEDEEEDYEYAEDSEEEDEDGEEE